MSTPIVIFDSAGTAFDFLIDPFTGNAEVRLRITPEEIEGLRAYRLGMLYLGPSLPNLESHLSPGGKLDFLERDLVVLKDRFSSLSDFSIFKQYDTKLLYLGHTSELTDAAAAEGFLTGTHVDEIHYKLGNETLKSIQGRSLPGNAEPDWPTIVSKNPIKPLYLERDGISTLLAWVPKDFKAKELSLTPMLTEQGEEGDLYYFKAVNVDATGHLQLQLQDRLQKFNTPSEAFATGVLASISAAERAVLEDPSLGDFEVLRLKPSSSLFPDCSDHVIPKPLPCDPNPFSDAELKDLNWIDGNRLFENVAPWCGLRPLPGSAQTIRSRKVGHSQNEIAARALARELSEICGEAWLVPSSNGTAHKDAFHVEATLVGDEQPEDLVIVSAHLDSATKDGGDAPGADDDASGIGGVLATARVLRSLAKGERSLARSVRFLLFNSEEYGMFGSDVYVSAPMLETHPIAMLHMDMIGWHGVGEFSYELHGAQQLYSDQSCQEASNCLTLFTDSVRSFVSETLEPEIFPRTVTSSAPASSRSDHSNFVSAGWPAILISEDSWSRLDDKEEPIGNPNYHTADDQWIDNDYAAEITRVVAATAWALARSEKQ